MIVEEGENLLTHRLMPDKKAIDLHQQNSTHISSEGARWMLYFFLPPRNDAASHGERSHGDME